MGACGDADMMWRAVEDLAHFTKLCEKRLEIALEATKLWGASPQPHFLMCSRGVQRCTKWSARVAGKAARAEQC